MTIITKNLIVLATAWAERKRAQGMFALAGTVCSRTGLCCSEKTLLCHKSCGLTLQLTQACCPHYILSGAILSW